MDFINKNFNGFAFTDVIRYQNSNLFYNKIIIPIRTIEK